MGWWDAFLVLLGIGKGVTDLANKSADAKKEDRIEKQGESNATAKQQNEALAGVLTANRAVHDPVIDQRVRDRWERP